MIDNEKIREIKHILYDIQECLKNGTFMGALFMCLALPDICGKVDYPNERSKARYIKWFNDNCDFFFNPLKEIKTEPASIDFDANNCYDLRCAVLHSGDSDIPNVDYFDLQFDKELKDGFVF